ncbi:MAG: hypothetical protein AAF662_10660 [Pseudomonadota bacterium]
MSNIQRSVNAERLISQLVDELSSIAVNAQATGQMLQDHTDPDVAKALLRLRRSSRRSTALLIELRALVS